MLNRVLIRLEAAVRDIGLAAAIVLLPSLIAVRLFEIYTRALLNQPGSLFNALERELFALLILLIIGSAYVSNSHVRVDVLRDRLSPRSRSIIELLGGLFFVLPLGLVVFWYGTDMVWTALKAGERAAIGLGAPVRWLLVAVLPMGIGLFLVAVFARIGRHILFLAGEAPDPDPVSSLVNSSTASASTSTSSSSAEP